MNYCYICSNKKCDLLVILQRLSKEHKPNTKGIARVYDRVGKQSAKTDALHR